MSNFAARKRQRQKNMINRELIRVKVVQLTYAYYQNGNNNIDAAEKELVFSLSKAYDLYNYLLSLMVAVTKEAREYYNVMDRKARREQTERPSMRFADNRFVLQLENNRMLNEFLENKKMTWEKHVEYVKRLFQRILDAQFYKDYLKSDNDSYEHDKEVWRKIYKAFIMDNDDLEELLEDDSREGYCFTGNGRVVGLNVRKDDISHAVERSGECHWPNPFAQATV